MSLWLLTVFFGNMLDAVITKMNILSGLAFFLFFATLMFLVALGFIWAAITYRVRDYTDVEVEIAKPFDSADGNEQSDLLTASHHMPSRNLQ